MSGFDFGFGDSGSGGGGGASDFGFGFGDSGSSSSDSASASSGKASDKGSSASAGLDFGFGDSSSSSSSSSGGGGTSDFGFGDFGGSGDDKKKSDKDKKKSPEAKASSGGDGFGFGDSSSSSSGADSGGFSFGGDDEKKSSAADSSSSSSSAAAASDSASSGFSAGAAESTAGESLRDEASRLKKKTVAEVIALWNRDLEEHISAFTEQALEVKKWDQHIFETGNDLVALQRGVDAVREEQQELNNVLETIRVDQQDLVAYVGRLEESLAALGPSAGAPASGLGAGHAGGHDEAGRRLAMGAQSDARRREESYQRAAEINQQLRQMETLLQGVVRDLNQAAERQVDQNSPMAQVVKILNGQFQSLQWIETHAADLGQKLQQSRKRLQQAQELGARRH